MPKWRPEGWKNPYPVLDGLDEGTLDSLEDILPAVSAEMVHNAFEASADAMLEALKTLGQHYDDIEAPYRTIGVLKEIKEPGTLVFIPDDAT